MADNSVFISGITDGALAKELSSLPGWATESTAKNIQGILAKTYALQSKAFAELIKKGATGGLSPEEMAEFNKSIKDANKALKKQEDSEATWKKKTDAERKKEEKRRQADGDYFDKKAVKEAAILYLQTEILQAYKQNFAAFTSLNEAGINLVAGFDSVRDGFDGVAQLSALTGVRYTELAASMEKYNTAINAFGAGKFAKTVGQSSASLAQFGFSSKEAADLLGAYLDSQSNFTNIQNKTQSETTQDLAKFGERIMKLSIATGQSRTAILANLKSVTDSTEANILQGQAGAAAAESTLEFVSSLKNQQFGRQLLKMMTDQIKPLNQTFQSFQKIGQGGFAQKMTAFTESLKGMDPAEQAQALKSFEEANHAEIEHNKQQANLYSQIPELAGEANAALETYKGLQQSANAVTRISAEELEKLKKTNKSRADFNTQYEKLMSTFQRIFSLSTPALDALTLGLTGLNWVIDKTVALFKFFDDVILAPIMGSFGDTGKYIAEIGSLNWAGFAFAAAALINLTPKLVKGLLSLLSKSAGPASDLLSSGAGGGKGKGKAGNAVGGLLSGVGKGVGNILEGIAKGLSALGSPKVLLGVVALAGIASALWITGKAVQQFVGLDWKTLAQAGVALVGLGLAGAAAGLAAPLIALGAGALGLMGGALWIIGEAIQATGTGLQLFATSLDTLSKLNGDNLGNVAKGLGELGVSIVAFSASSLFSSTGIESLTTIVGLINSLDLAKATAFASIGNAKSVSLPSPSTASTSPSTPKPSTLNSPSQVSSSPDTEGAQSTVKESTSASAGGTEKPATADDVSSAIGYQSSLLEQLLQATNSVLSVNKDILKYAKVNA